MTDEFTATLNRFCERLSEKIACLAEEEPDDGVTALAEAMLQAVRETIANLAMLEIECERVLRHA